MNIKKIKLMDNVLDPLFSLLDFASPMEDSPTNLKTENSIKIVYDGPTYQNTNDGFYSMVQKFAISNAGNIIVPSGVYSNHLTEFVAPVHINKIATNDDTKATCSGYVKAKFNYVAAEYERWGRNLNERLLPCMYLENDPYQTTSPLKVFPRIYPKQMDFYSFDWKLKGRYKIPNATKNKNIVFGQDYSLSNFSSERHKYPFFTNVRFNFNTTNEFKNTLESYNFFEHFLDDFLNSERPSKTFKIKTTHKKKETSSKSFELFDIMDWLQKSDFSFDNENKLFFSMKEKYKSNYQYYLDKVAFVGKMRKFCKNKMRTLEDIHQNKESQIEIMFYKIDKHVENNNTPVQSFWISADRNFIDYIDTQVKYGVKYTYRVTAYVLIYGCTYEYQNITKQQNIISGEAVVKPSFKIVEVADVFVDYCKVIQPPQPTPNVQFVNESNKKDYVKIYLNMEKNSETRKLIPLNPSELSQEDLRKEYDRLDERPRFVYNSEKALYEIYRMDKKPRSYDDLRGNKIAEVRNPFPSTGAVYKDFIPAWKKHYYVIRCINYHGLVSNPTPVYEVEITKDADESFLDVSSVEFHKDNFVQPTRTFMKLLQAIPATQHTYYDEEKIIEAVGGDAQSLRGTAINKMTLGGATHPIWGKKFKFRITSKETGRKVDVNIKVNLIKKKTKENSK